MRRRRVGLSRASCASMRRSRVYRPAYRLLSLRTWAPPVYDERQGFRGGGLMGFLVSHAASSTLVGPRWWALSAHWLGLPARAAFAGSVPDADGELCAIGMRRDGLVEPCLALTTALSRPFCTSRACACPSWSAAFRGCPATGPRGIRSRARPRRGRLGSRSSCSPRCLACRRRRSRTSSPSSARGFRVGSPPLSSKTCG